MSSYLTPSARYSSPGSRPRKYATQTDSVATLFDCFSELYTEKFHSPEGTILHVESLLRAHPPKHLSSSQWEMRHLLLDLMLVYADRKSNGGLGLDRSDSPEELLFFLLLHTAGRELAEAYVSQMGSLPVPDQQKVKKWTDESGILMEEWALI